MRNDRIMQEGSTAVALAMVTPGYDQDPASGVADYTTAHHQDQAQFEADKRAVYKHPLFPLLALLFERCEQATQSSDNSTAESFNMDIQAFVQHQERDRKPFLINDPEIDGLMIKAIQVLRIHLLELEKVQELCKDFCNRYITCLKGKMQSENLLRSDYGHHGSHDGLAPSSGSNGSSPLQVLSSTGNDVEPGANGFRVNSNNNNNNDNSNNSASSRGVPAGGVGVSSGITDALSENGSRSGLDDHQSQILLQQQYRPPSAISSSSGGQQRSNSDYGQADIDEQRTNSPPSVLGSTPFSRIGVQHHQAPVNDMYLGQEEVDPFADVPDRLYVEEASYWGLLALQDTRTDYNEFLSYPSCYNITVAGSPSSAQSEDDDEVASAAGVGSLSGSRTKTTKPKRGVLPKQATNIMRAWLFQHLVHPYPTEDEKRQISQETNLTMLQVNNWFINARRRILQPMLDGAGTATTTQITNNAADYTLQQQRTASSGAITKQQQHRAANKQRNKQLNQQRNWLSEDSGSETNGSSDGDTGGAYAGMGTDKRIGREDDEEDSEDGCIDIEEQKPYVH